MNYIIYCINIGIQYVMLFFKRTVNAYICNEDILSFVLSSYCCGINEATKTTKTSTGSFHNIFLFNCHIIIFIFMEDTFEIYIYKIVVDSLNLRGTMFSISLSQFNGSIHRP